MLRRGAAECRSGVYAPSPQILVNCGQARTELRARGRIDRRHPATSARPEWLGSKDPAPATRRGFYLRWPYAEAARGTIQPYDDRISAQAGTGFDGATGSAVIARYAFGTARLEQRVVPAWKPQPNT